MTFRLVYEILHDQSSQGREQVTVTGIARVVRIELEYEPASPAAWDAGRAEIAEAVNAFLTVVTGEREVLHRATREAGLN